jgi:hypothetical protein
MLLFKRFDESFSLKRYAHLIMTRLFNLCIYDYLLQAKQVNEGTIDLKL